jgi:hypothetical protein
MEHKDDDNCPADTRKYDEPTSRQGKRWGKIVTATKVVRAITAIVVFGIPVVTGTAILLGYGVHKLYERVTGRS